MKGESSTEDININEHFIVNKVLQELKLESITLHVRGNSQLYISGELTDEEFELLKNTLIAEFSNYTTNQLIQEINIKTRTRESN